MITGERAMAGQRLQRPQAGGGTVDHCQRDRPVERDDRRGLEREQVVVELQHVRPVGRGLVGCHGVAGRDGSLHVVDGQRVALGRAV